MARIPNNGTIITQIVPQGNSSYTLWPKVALRELGWKNGDSIVIRFAGGKAVVERVPSEKLAILRTGEPGRVA